MRNSISRLADLKTVPSNSTSIRLKNLFISLAIFVALGFYASTYSEPVLRVSLIPDESPSVLRRKIKPLTDYLEKRIGMKIEFRPMADGDALVEALLDNKLDMVWVDGQHFAKARSRSNGQVIALVRRVPDERSGPAFTAVPGYHEYSWTVRADMDVNLRLKLTDALLALDSNNAPDKAILDLQRAGRFIPAGAAAPSAMEAQARRAGQAP